MGDNVCDINSILRNFEPTKTSYGKDFALNNYTDYTAAFFHGGVVHLTIPPDAY